MSLGYFELSSRLLVPSHRVGNCSIVLDLIHLNKVHMMIPISDF